MYFMTEARGEKNPVLLVESGTYNLLGDQLTLTTQSIQFNLAALKPDAQKVFVAEERELQKRVGKPLTGKLTLSGDSFRFIGKDETGRAIQINLRRRM
jgi:hypothetical protein